MASAFTSSLYHVVFSTKGRRQSIPDEVRPRLWAYIGGIAREHECRVLAVGGVADHAHLLLSLPATMPISKAVQIVKGGSSRWLHEQFPEMAGFAWQAGYGAFSIGVSHVDDTVAYIGRQREHHGRVTFEEEFRAFLERNGIEFDERYAWD